MKSYQEIFVLIIIGIAAAIAVYKVIKHLTAPLQGCNSCASDCSGCQIQDLKKEMEENKKRKAG